MRKPKRDLALIFDFLSRALIDINGIKGEVGNETAAFFFFFVVGTSGGYGFVVRRCATDVTLKCRFVSRMKTYEGTEAF